ncbi:hypothetical protein AB0J20_16255 [Micromonospora costi]|uniref:hypothetical protein n=1 Tax=Micromonospora costi TaxID=1530042 RepID=UPI0033C83E61
MGWPDDQDLQVKVEAAFGADVTADPGIWSWTDLSSRMQAEPIRIRVGKSSGAQYVSPRTCAVTLDNADGALTPANPMSPYWPNVDLGTPLRVSVFWGGVWRERFAGFADQWEPNFLPTTEPGVVDSVVQVTASGLLRRLGQGKPPTRSALRRTIAATNPVAYFPAEDGIAASAAGSALSNASALTVTGVVEFKPVDDYQYNNRTTRYGTSALADLSTGGSMYAVLHADASSATTAAWTVHTLATVDPATLGGDLVMCEWTTPAGTHKRWQLVVTLTGRTQVIAYDAAGASTVVVDRNGVVTSFTAWAVTAEQSGGNIQVTYWLTATIPITGTVAGTLGGVASLAVNPTGVTSDIPTPVGHLAVWASTEIPYRTAAERDSYGGSVVEALRSYAGETATDRLARLTAEDGVSLDIPTVGADSVQRMGWQHEGTPMDLYRECEDVDGGILYEQGFGLAYLPREGRYNRSVDLEVDLAAYRVARGGSGDVLRPVYDDQGIRNELTVSRTDGSSVVVADPESQRRHGVYDDSIELNLASDDQLADQASWRLHVAAG